ncbi:MAG: hypothetical protein HC848_07985 [Limnobacter sp.]|nr:hypothetical protein [Limnobacter sp.]
MIEALHSQFFGKGYNLSEADLDKAKGKLTNLEREQQAVLVEEYWKMKFGGKTSSLPLAKVEPLARQVFKASVNVSASFFLDRHLDLVVATKPVSKPKLVRTR